MIKIFKMITLEEKMLVHIFNDDSVCILIKSEVIKVPKSNKYYDKIAENLRLRNWDLVINLIEDLKTPANLSV